MLDDINILNQRDTGNALGVASKQYQQTQFKAEVINSENDGRPIYNIVIAGMGGSALAAVMAKTWLKSDLPEPFEIIRGYELPNYVDNDTLVIASSYSGNTEETIACLQQAINKNAQVAVISSGGKLAQIADQNSISHVVLPAGIQPRYGVIYNLRALIALLANFGIVSEKRFQEIADTADWLQAKSQNWTSGVPTASNYAKVLALKAVGKTAVFYGGELTAPVAYKWKISWNENAKNLAFWNEYPEFNHNEFLGWTSHPIEKPFAVFDIISPLENSQVLKRFEVTDRLLSGMRPKSTVIKLEGDTLIKQMLWGSVLADFVSIYLAILNNIDPTPVVLIEKLKTELV